MWQSMMRSILIPVIAIILAVVFWGAIANPAAQARSASALLSGIPLVQALSNKHDVRAETVPTYRAPSSVQSEVITYTIQPFPRQKALQLLGAQPIAKQTATSPQSPSITFLKTVVLSAAECKESITHEVVVPPTTTVTYCYIVFNTGTMTLTSHSIIDAQNGLSINDLAYELTPSGTDRSAAFFPVSRLVTQTMTSSATWTAKSDNIMVSASDKTTVIVPTIEIYSTIAANSKKCGHEKSLRVASNTPLLYCYQLKNTSPITLPLQTLVDSTIGTLLENQMLPLPAGALMTISHAVTAIQSSTSMITWTSTTTNHVKVMASDMITVQVPASIQLTASASLTNDACHKNSVLTVKAGSTVIFCYLIRNNGGTTLTYHQIHDQLYGHDPFTETVGIDQVLAVTIPTMITQTLNNRVTWTAHNQEGATAIANAVVHVTVTPSITTNIFVYYDVDQDKFFDPLESGLVSVSVTLSSSSGLIFMMQTNDKGIATFTGLPELGRYTIKIDPTSLPTDYVQTEIYENITITDLSQISTYLGYTSPDTTDYDRDEIFDLIEGPEDYDKDGIANYQDQDSDNDSLPDSLEGTVDLDNDGKFDFLDPVGEPNIEKLYLPAIVNQ